MVRERSLGACSSMFCELRRPIALSLAQPMPRSSGQNGGRVSRTAHLSYSLSVLQYLPLRHINRFQMGQANRADPLNPPYPSPRQYPESRIRKSP